MKHKTKPTMRLLFLFLLLRLSTSLHAQLWKIPWHNTRLNPNDTIQYYEDSTINRRYVVQDGETYRMDYHPNGQLAFKVSVELIHIVDTFLITDLETCEQIVQVALRSSRDVPKGWYQSYYPNGNPREAGHLVGTVRYNSNGSIYYAVEPKGVWKLYHEDGNLWRESDWGSE